MPANNARRPRGRARRDRRGETTPGAAYEHVGAIAAATAASCIAMWTLPHIIAPRLGWSPIVGELLWTCGAVGVAVGAVMVGRFADGLRPRPFLGGLFVASGLALVVALMAHRVVPTGPGWASQTLAVAVESALLALTPGLAVGGAMAAAARALVAHSGYVRRGTARLVAAVGLGVVIGWALCEFALRPTTPHTVSVEMAAGALAALGLWYLSALLIADDGGTPRTSAIARDLPAKERKLAKAEAPAGWVPAVSVVFALSAGAAGFATAVGSLALRTARSSVYDEGILAAAIALGLAAGSTAAGRRTGSTPRIEASRALGVFTWCAVAALSAHNTLLERGELAGILPQPLRMPVHLAIVAGIPAAALGASIPPVVRWVLALDGSLGKLVGAMIGTVACGALIGGILAAELLPQTLGPSGLLGLVVLASGVGAWWFRPRGPFAVSAVVGGGAACLLMLWGGPPLRDLAELLRVREARPVGLVEETQGRTARVRVLDDLRHPGVQRLLVDASVQDISYLPDPTRLLAPRDMVVDGVLQEWLPEPEPVRLVAITDVGNALAIRLLALRPGSSVALVGHDTALQHAKAAVWSSRGGPDVQELADDPRVHLLRAAASGDTASRYDVAVQAVPRIAVAQMHLVTKEFAHVVADSLSDDGLYVVTVSDRLPDARLLAALTATLRSAFQHVSVFATAPRDAARPEPFVVAASKLPFSGIAVDQRLRARYADFDGAMLLPDEVDALLKRVAASPYTDEWAPVRLHQAASVSPHLAFDLGVLGLD